METAPGEVESPSYTLQVNLNENLTIEHIHDVLDEMYGDGTPALLTCGNANEEPCEPCPPID
jgi:hypothetical protein